MERDRVIDVLRGGFVGRDDALAAYLFGSVARAEARPSSDVDAGVVLRAGRPRDLVDYGAVLAMQEDLERALGGSVEVIEKHLAHIAGCVTQLRRRLAELPVP